jgi:hypothetical protein
LFFAKGNCQTLGGSSVFNFLNLSNTPRLTALGGVNISVPSNDVGLAFNNPALLNKEMHTQLNTVFNNFYAGINAYHLSFAIRNEKLKTNFAGGITYFDYGKITSTDASGNIYGSLSPTDWVMQVSASRSYLQKWNYGVSFKFISSNYGMYKSNGIAMDVGVLYKDSAKLFSVSLLAKNMGVQLKTYAGTQHDDLPFDLQAGITKRLKDAPFGFSFTAQHLHQFDIRYNDTSFNNDNGMNNNGNYSIDNIFRHFVFAMQVFPVPQIEISAGYNHLRRQELNISNSSNGLNGFSMGVGLLIKKLQVHYARTYYQNNKALNQMGFNLKLNEYFGLGKMGQRIGW